MNLKWDTCKITFVKTEYVFGILTKAKILNGHILALVHEWINDVFLYKIASTVKK